MSKFKPFPYLVFVVFALSISLTASAQSGKIQGTIRDKANGETLIGANILVSEGKGATTDINGQFTMDLAEGDYVLKVSYVGYQPKEIKAHVTANKTTTVDFTLSGVQLSEVEVVGDVAVTRETPVAFTTIPSLQLQEQLASRDIPMLLNKTPGVYATQSGGGDGDARINIRGFNQRNVAVMFDGVPMNDMENGWVYWSNWFGTDNVTRNVQVQRGLGASKLALPSVGGTINIITKGIDAKRSVVFKTEVTSNDDFTFERNDYRSTLSMTSGKLKGGWGVTSAISMKKGHGWADNTGMQMYSWFGKVEKTYKSHIFSLTGFGAPQGHSQRPFRQSIATYDADMAVRMGVDTVGRPERGIRYNPHWGDLKRTRGEVDTAGVASERVSERYNYFHKPVFSLKDFWTISDRMYWSNILYASFGNGGGTTTNSGAIPMDAFSGQYNFQAAYNANAFGPYNVYANGERKATSIIKSSINNHKWYGYLSTLNYQLTKEINITGGVDMRTYRGLHFRQAYDLLGGDIYLDGSDRNAKDNIRHQGDKIDYNNDARVNWGGAFALAEYKKNNLTAFINASGFISGYQRIDYFRKKDVVVDGKVFSEVVDANSVFYYSNGDTLTYQTNSSSNSFYYKGDSLFVTRKNGSSRDTFFLKNPQAYDMYSEAARPATTDWKWLPGFTLKGGANYNFTNHLNAFANVGYLSRTPRFSNVIDNSNNFYREIKNEQVKAAELGVSFHSPKFTANLNGYYTLWENKPVDRAYTVTINDQTYSTNINGLDALHKGVELDFAYKMNKKVTFEGMASLGDWRWNSSGLVNLFDDNGVFLDSIRFDAKGVHVGDAAQNTYSATLRYEPIKRLYVSAQYSLFTKNFSDFNPLDLKDSTAGRESWQLPDYYLIDAFAGYGFTVSKVKFDVRLSVLNLLNTVYISDATNNDSNVSPNRDFDANSAGVFMGLGRRMNLSLTATF